MKITIDFHYPIKYVPYRHQNKQVAYGGGSTDVEISEVLPEDAPVVFAVGTKVDGPFKTKSDGSLRQVRQYDGSYWVETMAEDNFSKFVSDPMTIDKTPFSTVSPVQFF